MSGRIDFNALDNATDFTSLVMAWLDTDGYSISNGEIYVKSPFDPTQAPDKFSINVISGAWQCHKSGRNGSFTEIAKQIHGTGWKKAWAETQPNAARYLGLAGTTPGKKKIRGGSDAPPSFSARVAEGGRRASPRDLDSYAKFFGVEPTHFVAHRIYTARVKYYGPEPKLYIPVWDPTTNDICGIKMRSTTADIKIKNQDPVKSKNTPGTKVGLIGYISGEDSEKPIFLVEGEKDQIVAAWEFRDEYYVMSGSHGAKTWRSSMNPAIKDRDVVLMYDEDADGNAGVLKAAAIMYGEARSIRIAHMPATNKDLYDHLRDEDGLGLEAIRELLREAAIFDPQADPDGVDKFMRVKLTDDELSATQKGDLFFTLVTDNGGLFIKGDGKYGYCSWQGKVYSAHQSDPYWTSLINKYTNIGAGEREMFQCCAQISMRCQTLGKTIAPTSWYARKNNRLYLAMYGDSQRMIEISVEGIIVRDNGYEEVILLPDTSVPEFSYLEDSIYDAIHAKEVWDRFIGLFNLRERWRNLVESFIKGLPFYDWCDTKPLFRIEGDTGSGKSFITKAVTLFLYGVDGNQADNTQAAIYRLAERQILMPLDNIENTDLAKNHTLVNFLLCSSTGMTRYKSASDSEKDIVKQTVNCWIVTTGKSPIGGGWEDIEERLLVVPVGGNVNPNFEPTAESKWVKENRNLIFSYWIREAQTTLIAILSGHMKEIKSRLPKDHRRRLHEWYAIAALCNGDRGEPSPESLKWLSSGSVGERESIVDSNTLVPFITAMPMFFKDTDRKREFSHIKFEELGSEYVITLHRGELETLFLAIGNLRRGYLDFKYRGKSLGKAIGRLKKDLELSDRAITIEGMGTKQGRRVDGTRDRFWRFTVNRSEIEVDHGFTHDTESFVGMDSGDEIIDQGSTEDVPFVDEEGVPRF